VIDICASSPQYEHPEFPCVVLPSQHEEFTAMKVPETESVPQELNRALVLSWIVIEYVPFDTVLPQLNVLIPELSQ
jgi:hypothetical protein